MPIRLTDIVTNLADHDPMRQIFVFVVPDRDPETSSVGQLDHAARRIAASLQGQGIQPGTILPLVFDHGYELVAAFWGAMYLGAVPTILPYLSADAKTKALFGHIERVTRFVRAEAILTSKEARPYLIDALPDSGCRILALPPLQETSPLENGAQFPKTNSLDLPYIQFSSGTTGLPKGVMLSHRALLHHMQMVGQAQAITSDDVSVGWLPLYHDMGLVNQVLRPLYYGYQSVMLSPADWLGQPERLFEAVSKYRGTLSWMPNFAFRYCVRRIRDDQLTGLDLSSWRILGNGAEPVQSQDLEAFSKRFAAYGFRREALKIGYGLAEHVAGVTYTLLNCAPDVDWISEKGLEEQKALPAEPHVTGSRPIVSCGVPLSTVRLQIVNEAGESLSERQVGQILVQSPCLFSGYYLLPDESAQAMKGAWLDTGDLGYLADGQLYVCGRKKDLIIVGGRNIHPTQIEEVVESVLGKQCRFTAAFGIPNSDLGTEVPVVVCEMRQLPDEVSRARLQQEIRERVQQELQLFLSDICMVEAGWIAKTTSGKINRTSNRAKYLAERKHNEIPALTFSTTSHTPAHGTATEQQLIGIWQKLFKRPTLNVHDNFFALGGDSLLAIQLMLEIQEHCDCNLSAAVLLEAPTITALAALVDEGKQSPVWNRLAPLQAITPQSHQPIFFCVHGLGGGILGYKPLSDALGPGQPFYCLQPRGLDGTRQTHDSIDEMAAQYIQAMKIVQPRGPYYVGGYCFGGVVAFEIARQLSRAAEQVGLVAIFEGYAPVANAQGNALLREWQFAYNFARNLPFWLRDYLRLRGFQLQARNRRVKRVLVKRFMRLGGRQVELETKDVVDDLASLPRQHQRVLESHIAAMRNYAPTPYNGRLVLFRTPHRLLQAPDRDMGWRRLTTGPVEIEMIAGSHGTILEESNVSDLADKLKSYLLNSPPA